MKRILNLRNRAVVAILFMGFLFTTSSFTFGPVGDAKLVGNPPQKKEQKVKVTVNVDGKVTKIDTTFNLPDEKMIQVKVDSMLKKMEITGLEPGMKNIVIHRGGKRMMFSNKDFAHFPGNEQFDIMIQQGDSGMAKHERKIIRMGDDGSIVSSEDNEGDNFLPVPPPPPEPPYPPMMFEQLYGGDHFSFDGNDKSVISYNKKDIGKGLEKITIIRKKQPEHKGEIEVTTEISDDSKK